MGRRCTVCDHPYHDQIDATLIARTVPFQRIAHQYRLRQSSVERHYYKHLAKLAQKTKEVKALTHTLRLIQRLAELDAYVDRALQRAEATGDDRTGLLAVREARANVMAVFQIGTVSEMEQRLQALEQSRYIDGYLGEPDDTRDYDDDTEENADG